MTKLGRTCFPYGEALAIAADLRDRGYEDAHVEFWESGRFYPKKEVPQ